MMIRFTKMHGLGNDFVVIDGVRQQVSLTPDHVRFLAHRRLGVGCDQVLMVEPPSDPGRAAFRYRIFNADGNEVEQCGNGARCFAVFVRDQGLTRETRVPVETAAGIITLQVEADGQVTVDMGPPRLAPWEIPFEADKAAPWYSLAVNDQTLEIGAVSMGNPHAVLRVDNVQTAAVARLGPAIEGHPRFPRRVNAGFMEVVSPTHVRLRVYERGAGETLACGTGACAAVVAGRIQGLLEARVDVDLPGGRLVIQWAGREDDPVFMTGPATSVFTGTIEL
ncbi:diaminopimelate epimerase [Ectothiorhodospira lacustris]|uniref:diaminopimelate epimerase n=1 Tax=Ectothiorhodospira lacustris TaxID=2899127 RepID=UPI001EE8EC82|nr:diaminopimelate epimerase [Ectothiorhodospira lacustris]MCG5499321.1 diaminopimelate epimerase [Ectothiorhodospira lacustris]MCG5509210.1 diaminopimelate epimerase [Ectothiorhodospira lacustris]MCG5521000.1 diaminopimelate epimerase [Ectothiorhodospira lacustris]